MPSSRFIASITPIMAGFAVIGLILAACSPQPTPTPDATPLVIQPTIFGTVAPTDTPAPTATPQPTATPIPKKPIALPVAGPIDTLHPFYATSPAAQDVLGALFVGCAGQDEKGQAIALGCEQVPTAENGTATFAGEGLDRYLQVAFKIRMGWRWTDGRLVTAQDAIYAWQLIMSPESGLRDPLTQSVFAMSAPDDRTIVVQFMSAAQAQAAAAGALRGDVPFEYFSQLGDYAAYADRETPLAPKDYWAVLRWLPAHLLRDVLPAQQHSSPFALQPIGDGAFEIEAISDRRVLLRPAARPFPLGNVASPGIEFVLDDQVPDDGPIVLQEPGATDVSAMTVVTFATGLEKLVLNVDHFPFDDVKVRQAVAHAINREALGQDAALSTSVPSALAYDPAKAAALLAEAGWDCDPKPCQKGFTDDAGDVVTRTLAFKLTTNVREPRNVIAQAIQRQLADVGFAVDAEIVFGLGKQSKLFAPYNQGGTLLSRNFDAALYQSPAPASAIGEFGCAGIPTAEGNDTSKGNASGFCEPAIDELLRAAEDGEATITAQRDAVLSQALQAVQQAAPSVPLYEVHKPVYVRGVTGLKPAAGTPITWNAWEWKAEP